MTRFAVRLLPPDALGPDGERLGEIIVGNFSERFVVAPFPECPDVSDIPEYWFGQLRAVLMGLNGLALRTQPSRAWVLYREDPDVFVQDHLITPEWDGILANDGRIIAVPLHARVTDQGERISEWATTLGDIEEFAAWRPA